MNLRIRSWVLIGAAVVVVTAVAVVLGPPDREAGSVRSDRVVVEPVEHPSAPASPTSGPVAATTDEMPTDVDGIVRAAVAGLSRHPQLAAWLVSDGLARRLVAAVEAVADGYSPREELAFTRPETPLYVRYEGVQAMITEASFHRYDLAAEVVASIDPAGLAEAYRHLEPQLVRVHETLPYARGELHARVVEAIDHLLAVEVPDGPYAVTRQTRTWGFADPDLEALSDAQRHLLRMGPRNARSVQASLRRFREALEPGAVEAVQGDEGGTAGEGAPAVGVVARTGYQEGSEASRSSTP